MSNLTLNEIAALKMVLDDVSVKELLHYAMVGFSTENNVRSQDCADLCSKSISTFCK